MTFINLIGPIFKGILNREARRKNSFLMAVTLRGVKAVLLKKKDIFLYFLFPTAKDPTAIKLEGEGEGLNGTAIKKRKEKKCGFTTGSRK